MIAWFVVGGLFVVALFVVLLALCRTMAKGNDL